MKKSNTKNNKVKLIIIICVVIIFLVLGGLLLFNNRSTYMNSVTKSITISESIVKLNKGKRKKLNISNTIKKRNLEN